MEARTSQKVWFDAGPGGQRSRQRHATPSSSWVPLSLMLPWFIYPCFPLMFIQSF